MAEMGLREKQVLFAMLISRLVYAANRKRGVNVRFAEVYDPPGSKSGRKSRSLHRSRLAADLILDLWDPKKRKWVYQRDTKAYAFLGRAWYRLHPLCEWGGASRDGTPRHDGNHFSLSHGGRW